MTTFPRNPAHSLLIADLSVQLQHIPNNSFIGIAVKTSAKENPVECIRMVQSQSRDNRLLMSDVIGEKLLRKIENLEV